MMDPFFTYRLIRMMNVNRMIYPNKYRILKFCEAHSQTLKCPDFSEFDFEVNLFWLVGHDIIYLETGTIYGVLGALTENFIK
jgi:hypothetical protein